MKLLPCGAVILCGASAMERLACHMSFVLHH